MSMLCKAVKSKIFQADLAILASQVLPVVNTSTTAMLSQ